MVSGSTESSLLLSVLAKIQCPYETLFRNWLYVAGGKYGSNKGIVLRCIGRKDFCIFTEFYHLFRYYFFKALL